MPIMIRKICAPEQSDSMQNKVPVTDPSRIYFPRTVGIRLTYRCNAKCAHCYCFNTEDQKHRHEIKYDDIRHVIPKAKALGINTVSMTGGEPFLLRRTVEAITKLACQNKMNVRISTNAYWASSYDKAVSTLKKLKSCGFNPPGDVITASAGQFHMDYIDRSCIVNAVNAYKAIFPGAPFKIDFEFLPGNERIYSDYLEYLSNSGLSEDDYAISKRVGLQEVGEIKNAPEVRDIPKTSVSSYTKPCAWVRDLIIDPHGDVFPCCGMNRYIRGLVIGNIHDSPLDSIVNSAQTNPVVKIIKRHPFNIIYDALKDRFGLSSNCGGICGACEMLFSDSEKVDYLLSNHSFHIY